MTIAKGFGVDGERVSDSDSLGGALKRGLNAGRPYVVVVDVDRTVPPLF